MKAYPSKAMLNRDLSWLKYNDRILQEGERADVPLFERANFIGIYSANLDDFFQRRLAYLLNQKGNKDKGKDDSGLKIKGQIKRAYQHIEKSCQLQGRIYHKWVKAAKEAGNPHIKVNGLKVKQEKRLRSYIKRFIRPSLSPAMIHEKDYTFANGRCYILVSMKKGRRGVVPLPPLMDRLVDAQAVVGEKGYFLLEDLIRYDMARLFPGQGIKATAVFRVTRVETWGKVPAAIGQDANMHQESRASGKTAGIMRVEAQGGQPWAMEFLMAYTGIKKRALIELACPLDLRFMRDWRHMQDGKDGFFPVFEPRVQAWWQGDLFEAIRKKDRIHALPYESYAPVLKFLEAAAHDDQVVAIWQTLYRVSEDSSVVALLKEAARKGKQVTVVVQPGVGPVEAQSLGVVKILQAQGCHVIVGHPAHKVHGKTILVVRKEEKGLRSYLHMGTGNYNEIRAMEETNFGLFTADEAMGRDLRKLFAYLSGAGPAPKMEVLAMAPFDLRERLMQQIQQMIVSAKRGEPAWIFLKMNALVDTKMINALYEASQAGVRVDCLIRGACCLRPGIAGISENIQVRSLVGRFLEHQRVFCFTNREKDTIYLSSADWMPRNLNHRVELAMPVEDKAAKASIKDWLKLQWQDERNTHVLDSQGDYHPLKRGARALDSQACLQEP